MTWIIDANVRQPISNKVPKQLPEQLRQSFQVHLFRN